MTAAQVLDKARRETAATDLPSYTEFELMAPKGKGRSQRPSDFERLVDEKIDLDRQKKIIEDRLKQIGPELEATLMAEGVERVAYRDGITVKIGKGRAPSKIVAAKLLEQGVAADIIAAATVDGAEYTFAQVVIPKDGGR